MRPTPLVQHLSSSKCICYICGDVIIDWFFLLSSERGCCKFPLSHLSLPTHSISISSEFKS